MRLEHLLSGEDVDTLYVIVQNVRQVAFAARPLPFLCLMYRICGVPLWDPSGGLAQLARAPALQAGGQRFESVILHVSGAFVYAL